MTEATAPSTSARVQRFLLLFFFIYGGLSYSLAIFEYTYFNLTGNALGGVERSYPTMNEEELKQEFIRCGAPLFGANSVETEKPGDLITVRCGKFWPLYRYSIEVPAHPSIPGALIQYEDEPQDIRAAKDAYVQNTFMVNLAALGLCIWVLGLTLNALFQLFVKKDQEQGYRAALKVFFSSLIMTCLYLAIMLYVDPFFNLGW